MEEGKSSQNLAGVSDHLILIEHRMEAVEAFMQYQEKGYGRNEPVKSRNTEAVKASDEDFALTHFTRKKL